MSALNEKIDSRARGSGATPVKLTAYVIYGLGLAVLYIYNAYSIFPHRKNDSFLLTVDAANTLLVNHDKSVCVCQFVHTFSHLLRQTAISALGFSNSGEEDIRFERKN